MSCFCTPCCIPVEIKINTGAFAQDSTWMIYSSHGDIFQTNGTYQDYTQYNYEHCLIPNTTYIFVAFSANGFGWNGGVFFLV